MIYTIGGIKGGSGKTTVATNLAVVLSLSGRDVLLIDSDDQGTAMDFTQWRNERMDGNSGFAAIQLYDERVRSETLKLAPKYDDVVIDTGGRDTTSQRAALTISDVFLIPFYPRSFDVWTIEKVAKIIREIQTVNPKLKVYAFLNRADSKGADNDGAAQALQETDLWTYIDAPLCNRKAFANAAAHGLSVMELRPRDKRAEEELEQLFGQFIPNYAPLSL